MRRLLASGRYIVVIAVIGTFVASLALIVFEALVIAAAVIGAIRGASLDPKTGKTLAVGLIEAVDVFLIAIAVYIISLGLHVLFVDERAPLPRWLRIDDLEDLKTSLVSIVIAVLAVLFLREAVAWDGTRDLLSFGAAIALIIAALSFFLAKKKGGREE
jgi:uncharacterized membrane protein YqhA